MNNYSSIKILASTLALLSAGSALGQDAGGGASGRVYVGGAIGQGGYDADFERTKTLVRRTGATAFNVTADAKDTMWKGYLGYRISPNLSVEAGYWNFGRASTSTAITAPVAAGLPREFRADGLGADAVAWLPLYNNWSGLLKAGAIRTMAKASASDPGGGLTALPAESARKLNSHWGLGVEYQFTRAASARLEYENVRKVGDDAKFGTADIILWTVGANYRF